MPTFIKANVTGVKEFNKKMDRMNPQKNTSKLKRAPLIKGALLVQKIAAKDKIVRGRPRHSAPLTDRLTSRHGGSGLAGSIRVNENPLPSAIEIGTDLGYGAIHEFGLGRYPKRPFLGPALKDATRKIEKFFEDALNRENRKP